MKRFLPLVLISLLILPTIAYAQDFTVSVIEEEEYLAGSVYTLPVTITNSGPEDWMSISVLGVPSDWMSMSTQSLKVKQGMSESMSILFAPPKDAKPGFYSYLLTVKRPSTGDTEQIQILTWVRQISSVIVTDFKLSCTTCVEDVVASGTVENVGTRDQEVTLKVSMGGDEKIHAIGVLNATEAVQFEDAFKLNETQPGDYMVSVELRNSTEHLIFSDERMFTITSLKNISYDKKISKNLFGIFGSLKATNNGNGNDVAYLSSEVINKWYIFYTGPKADIVSGDLHTWSIELGSGESANVNYSQIYWPVALILIILISSGIYMYIQLVTLSIRKIIKAEKGEDVTVTLHIKSKMRAAESVYVKDHIPLGFSITEKFETIKPLIRKKDDGIELIWKVGTIGKNEYRIINYKIKPTKLMPGKIELPPAVIRAKYGGRPAEEKSNPVFIYGEQDKGAKKTVSVKVE